MRELKRTPFALLAPFGRVSGAKVPRALLAVFAAATAVAFYAPSASAAAHSQHRPVPSLSPHVYLKSVSAVSATDAWAVGYYSAASHDKSTLILHWDGTAWSRDMSPSPSTIEAELLAVSADSSTDAWAVGFYRRLHRHRYALILHWNGASWSQVSGPVRGDLSGVTADSPTDAWATGASSLLHWDGTAWSRVRSPLGCCRSVSADSPTDAWGVSERGLIFHWNGRRWRQVLSGAPDLWSVSAESPTDAWAVGFTEDGENAYTAILHWDGRRWRKMRSPAPGEGISYLDSVSADSPTDAWAVGWFLTLDAQRTLALHWDGARWSRVHAPGGFALGSVSASSPTDAWVVASSWAYNGSKRIHWDGTSWLRS
jgi:hypothetical protein